MLQTFQLTNTHLQKPHRQAGLGFLSAVKGCFVEGLENKHPLLSIPLFKQAFKARKASPDPDVTDFAGDMDVMFAVPT